MQVRIEVDEGLLATLDRVAAVQQLSRDAAVGQALEKWLAGKPQSDKRSMDYLQGEYDPDFMSFEAERPGPEAMPEFHSSKRA